MTNEALLKKLVTNGAVVDVIDPDVYDTVGQAAIVGNKIIWMSQFAEDQHHTHTIQFDTVTNFYDRDLGFKDKAGKYLCYISPIGESGYHDHEALYETHRSWVAALRDADTLKRYKTFFANTDEAQTRVRS